MKNVLLIIVVIIFASLGLLYFRTTATPSTVTEQNAQTPVATVNPQTVQSSCVPTFLDGGGPYYQSNAPFREELSPAENNGEKLIVTGRVLQKDCVTPSSNVVLDIWQANETGNYEDEWYRGQVRTNESGEYTFTTVVPKGYGQGTGYRPPHIHFKVWRDTQLLITSQMFLPESRTQGIEEPYIMKVQTSEENGTRLHHGQHNIILP